MDGTHSVLLVSDHTYPTHYSDGTSGADGVERLYIDPVIQSLKVKLENKGVSVGVLNVEDLAESSAIDDRDKMNAAYGNYDEILQKYTDASATILAIHFDADIIEGGYIGGAQLILDERSAGAASVDFASELIDVLGFLEAIGATGLRIKPDFEREIKYQKNQTLNIIGASKGAGLLIEMGPMRQAMNLFGDPIETAAGLDKPLNILAEGIISFRSKSHHCP